MAELVKILLVDDQVRNLEALQAVLHPLGCRLITAQSADQALLALLQHDFAAIVLDIRMPGMDGFELAKLIKGRRRTRQIPIIFLTAHLLDDKDVLAGYQAGAVDYLTKPIDPEVLRAKINIFADLYRASQALSETNAQLQQEISERERVQEALRQANQQLEERVEARTAELVQAHAEIAGSEERLRIALAAGRMGTWELDGMRRVCHIDEVQCRLLGLPARTQTIALDTLLSLTFPEDDEAVRRAVERALKLDVPEASDYTYEFRIIRPSDNSVRWLLVSGRTVPVDGGLPRRIGVTIDITDRKHDEQTLQEADRRKNDFLATLAHELRNPLAPIRNAVELLRMKSQLPVDKRGPAEVIDRQTRALTRLVDDLLDISRITQNRLELRREPASLTAIVEAAIESSRPLIDSGGHRLDVSLPDEPIVLLADVTRVAQVISNLLNNAARYSDKKGQIHVNVTREGSEAVIKVSDEGIGIPASMLNRVFEMFVQVDRAHERGRGGLGVGLSLSRQLVEMHGGSITAHSPGPGLGSTFEVRLPIAAEVEASVRAIGVRDELPSTRFRLLVVDDNRDSVDSLSTLLRLMGNDVHMAYDGVEAVHATHAFRPDVVLLDVGLPLRNGYDAARLIRGEPWGREVILIALTGWGQEQDRRRSREAGFDHHLVKPVDPKALMSLVSELFHRNRRGTPVPADAAPLLATDTR
jgi:PAS domain S-box-containing protein